MSFIEGVASYFQVLTLIILSIQLYHVLTEAKRRRISENKRETLDYLAKHIDHNLEFQEWLRSFPKSRLLDPNGLTKDETKHIRSYLIIMERLSVGVRQNVYSMEIVANVVGKQSRRNFVYLKPYIDAVRSENNNTRIWDSFEWLAFNIDKASPENIIPNDWSMVIVGHVNIKDN